MSNHIFLYGKHPCLAALKNPKRKIFNIYISKNNLDILVNLPKLPKPQIIDNIQISKIIGKDLTHQGIAIQTTPLEEPDISDIITNNSKQILILDQITDPHNIGAILRSAAAFNIDALVLTKHNSSNNYGTIAKSACGALELVPIVIANNLKRTMDELKQNGFWCIGLAGETKEKINKTRLPKKIALIIGAEGSGLRRLTKENCDLLVKIPINKQMESLNASNAAAIALYEATKQND